MLPSKNNGTSIGHSQHGLRFGSLIGLLVGLICAAIASIATFTAGRVKALRAGLKPKVIEQVLTPRQAEQARRCFFTATFSIMGHVVKANGPVKKSHITFARNVMKRMDLTAERCDNAIELFNNGKQSEFDLDRQVKQFRDGCAASTDLYRVFLETQIEAALADGYMARSEEAILLHMAKVLGISKTAYRQLEMLVRVSLGLGDNHNDHVNVHGAHARQPRQTRQVTKPAIHDAYGVLGVQQGDQRETVKAAYRKLMNEHHPDKLEAKGLPKEMLKLSTNKVQDIQNAYQQIKLANCW